ncbi:hypothetical protein KJ807_05655 [Patescibacteria group bacterium]|nr:hypothetical protein [Patescibacteria group bacterium]
MSVYPAVVRSENAGDNPLQIRFSEEMPGTVHHIVLKNWVITDPAVAPSQMIQLKMSGLHNKHPIVFGCNEGMIQVPFNGNGIQWEGQPIDIYMASPMPHLKTMTIEVYGAGERPTALTGGGLLMSFWFEVVMSVPV